MASPERIPFLIDRGGFSGDGSNLNNSDTLLFGINLEDVKAWETDQQILSEIRTYLAEAATRDFIVSKIWFIPLSAKIDSSGFDKGNGISTED